MVGLSPIAQADEWAHSSPSEGIKQGIMKTKKLSKLVALTTFLVIPGKALFAAPEGELSNSPFIVTKPRESFKPFVFLLKPLPSCDEPPFDLKLSDGLLPVEPSEPIALSLATPVIVETLSPTLADENEEVPFSDSSESETPSITVVTAEPPMLPIESLEQPEVLPILSLTEVTPPAPVPTTVPLQAQEASMAPVVEALLSQQVQPVAKKVRVRLTFYSGKDDQWGSRVAWREVLQAKLGRTVAADPTLFPYGTWIHIPGFGVHRVEDTGTAVKSRKASAGKDPVIDIYVGEESEVNRLANSTPEYVEITLL